eukprot:1290845-Rhodomonas_salina.3
MVALLHHRRPHPELPALCHGRGGHLPAPLRPRLLQLLGAWRIVLGSDGMGWDGMGCGVVRMIMGRGVGGCTALDAVSVWFGGVVAVAALAYVAVARVLVGSGS